MHVSETWMQPLSGCNLLSDPHVLVEAVVGIWKGILSVAPLGDVAHIVSAGGDGIFRAHESGLFAVL